jgi:hypothetical protein
MVQTSEVWGWHARNEGKQSPVGAGEQKERGASDQRRAQVRITEKSRCLRTLKAPIGVWFLVLDDDLDAGARLEPRSNAPLVSGWFSARSLTIEQVIRAWP